MIEANQKVLMQKGRKEKVEVIFVNDYPNEKLIYANETENFLTKNTCQSEMR